MTEPSVALEAPRSVKLTKLSDVRAEPPKWLLPGRIPYGAITVLAGRPDAGKSQFSIALAAGIGNGMPDTITGRPRVPVPTLIIGAEDSLANMVKPRAIAARANLDLIHALTIHEFGQEWSAGLPTDIPLIKQAIKDTGAGLVIFDPVLGHVDQDINPHSDHSLRMALVPLARMARDSGAAVLCVAHLNKGEGTTALNRLGGGVALGGVARSVLYFGEHKKEDKYPNRRYLVHTKSNMSKKAPPLECFVDSTTVRDGDITTTAPYVTIGDEDSRIDADDIA